ELVGATRVNPLVELSARDRGHAIRELPDRTGNATGDDRRRQTTQDERDDGQGGELPPGPRDLSVHPAPREADPHGPPPLAFHQDRHRDVVESLPVLIDDLLEHGSSREGAAGYRVGKR